VQEQLLLTIIATILIFGPKAQAQSPAPTLRKVAEFVLPWPPGKRFDYLTIDSDDHYLISAHLAAGQTYVIDLRTNKVVATVADTPGAVHARAEGKREACGSHGFVIEKYRRDLGSARSSAVIGTNLLCES
jgi:hypothetical protein